MGFLKFLKKREGIESKEEELDLPPEPPAIGDEDLGLESLGGELPKPPELAELPEIEEEPEEMIEEEKLEIPSFRPEIAMPLEKIREEPAKEEKKHLEEIREHKGITKPVFVALANYKKVTDEIEVIRNNLNNFDHVSLRLDDLKEDKNKRFTKWNEHLKDMQKKLIFVDKTLFVK